MANTTAEPEAVEQVELAVLEARICQGAANLTAAEAAWLALVAEFDDRRGWEPWGCSSCAAWLSWQVGLDMRAAREKVRVAHALREFPLFAEAMGRGELSYSKARAITRVATTATEADLLSLALAGTSNHIERIVAAYRRAEPVAEEADARAHHERALYTHTDGTSMEITLRVPVEAGKALLAAVERFISPDTSQPYAARRADALVELAEHVAAHTDAPAEDDARYLATLLVEADTIHGGDGCCELTARCPTDTATAIPVLSARRILCDAITETLVVDRDGNPFDLGRRARTVDRRLRRALRHRDGRCRFPGCDRRGWLDAHHIVHWLDHGHTKLENLVSLCRLHHRLVHEGGWTIEGTPATGLVFLDPRGRVVIAQPSPVAGDAGAVDAHDRSAADGRCQWTGEHLDLDLVIAGLQHTNATTDRQPAPPPHAS